VISEASPLNCRWIVWNGPSPVCRRPPRGPRVVTEEECGICEFWADGNGSTHGAERAPGSGSRYVSLIDPLERERCPRCGSRDVGMLHSEVLLQAFVCSICHQRWLATRR
jgi:hypothetical protein